MGDSSVVELSSGIDALYLSGRATVPPEVRDHLEEVRGWAVEQDSPVSIQVAGEELLVQPRSFGRYRFRLAHEFGLIGVTLSEKLPALRVQPSAEFLHAVGPAQVLRFFDEVCSEVVRGPVSWGLSRMDLYCDVQRWDLVGDDRHDFVCRGERLDTHEDGGAFTGFEFGRRTTKTVCARIYDKTRQIEKEGIDWWQTIWGDRFDPELQVLRVEFEIGRQGLVEFGISSPTEGLSGAPGVWASVTSEWLTHRRRTGDGTKSRWPVATDWLVIQQASLRDEAIGLDRVRAGKRRGDLRRLTPQVVGYLASTGAVLDLDDIGSVLGAVRALVSEDEDRRGVRFCDRVAEKQAEGRPA